jgi:hypothetical protein
VSEPSQPTVRDYTPTALPSVTARVLAFMAIVVGGVCGGLIAYSLTDLQCGSDDRRARTILPASPVEDAPPAPERGPADRGCTTLAGIAGLLGAAGASAGVAVIAVLVLRAMAEWRKNALEL